MNLLSKVEQYVKRQALADLVGTNETYLCVLSKKKELTPEMEKRIRRVIKQIAKEISKL